MLHRYPAITAVVIAASTISATLSARSEFQSEPGILNAPDEGKAPGPIRCRNAPDDAVARTALQQVLKSPQAAQQDLEQLRAATTTHRFPEWEAFTCELLRQKQITDQQYVQAVDDILPSIAASGTLPRPELLEPKNGGTFDHYPRRMTVSWERVAGAAQYLVEVQYRGMRGKRASDGSMQLEDAGWAPHNDGLHSAFVSQTSAVFYFIGAQRGRVRVRPIAENGDAGPASQWRDFRFRR